MVREVEEERHDINPRETQLNLLFNVEIMKMLFLSCCNLIDNDSNLRYDIKKIILVT